MEAARQYDDADSASEKEAILKKFETDMGKIYDIAVGVSSKEK